MTGIPAEAFDFYDHLAVDNTKQFWADHKAEYEQFVREPLAELALALEPEFGSAKLYRPYRDIRFSKDKTPYKDHQGCLFAAENGLGWYLQVSAARSHGRRWLVHVDITAGEEVPRASARVRCSRPARGDQGTAESRVRPWAAIS